MRVIQRILFLLFEFVVLLFALSCTVKKESEVQSFVAPPKAPYSEISSSSFVEFPLIEGNQIVLKKDYDLKGKAYYFPPDVTIIGKGGCFRNGILYGDGTKIETEKAVFDHVTIKGRWSVNKISTDLFCNLNYVNSLRDVVALTNSDIDNTVLVKEGNYIIDLMNSSQGIQLCDNTNLILNGDILLKPNARNHYEIVHLNGDNISISGKGSIVGDKFSHKGTTGEHGHGIYVSGKKNSISGITIRECWGDCIYVRNREAEVIIRDCKLDNGRRQGISVTSARKVEIINCLITNIYGTNPQAAIDIEPNRGDTIDYVAVKKVKIRNCIGGIEIAGFADSSLISVVEINNCDVEKTEKSPFVFVKADNVQMIGCKAYECKKNVHVALVKKFEERSNIIDGFDNQFRIE